MNSREKSFLINVLDVLKEAAHFSMAAVGMGGKAPRCLNLIQVLKVKTPFVKLMSFSNYETEATEYALRHSFFKFDPRI